MKTQPQKILFIKGKNKPYTCFYISVHILVYTNVTMAQLVVMVTHGVV